MLVEGGGGVLTLKYLKRIKVVIHQVVSPFIPFQTWFSWPLPYLPSPTPLQNKFELDLTLNQVTPSPDI